MTSSLRFFMYRYTISLSKLNIISLDFKDTSTLWYNKQKLKKKYVLILVLNYVFITNVVCIFLLVHAVFTSYLYFFFSQNISYILCHSFLQCYIVDTSCIFLWQNRKKAEVFRQASEKSEPSWTLALGRISHSSTCDPFWSVSFDKCHCVWGKSIN